MKHKRSLEALIVGFVLAIAVSFFSTKIAGAVLAVSLIQMFAFYRCPHCGSLRTLQYLRHYAELPLTAARICIAKPAASA